MRKYAIVGSRSYPELVYVEAFVDSLPLDACVISGNARGVDMTAQNRALKRGLVVIIVPAQWEQHGKGAGFKRNNLIVQWADEVIAFWDGKSRGTNHSIELARNAGKPVKVFNIYGVSVG